MPQAKILIVDDDRTTATVIKLQLQNLGYQVPAIATSAGEAIDLARQHLPALILMDIQLGEGTDGIEAANMIQHELAIPIIYVTAHADQQTFQRAKRSRPLGYINKPLRENDLRTTLGLALDQIEQRRLLTAEEALSEALDYIATGVILLDQQLRVSFVNQIARDILNSELALSIREGALACETPEQTMQLQKLVLSEDGGSLLIGCDSTYPLQMLVTPLDARTSNYNQDLPIAIAFLFNPLKNVDHMIDTLRDMYQLTKAEARLAAALVQDPRLEKAAQSVHISISTARTHLKRIFTKTGTNSQSALVHRIVTGPAGLLLRIGRPDQDNPGISN